MAHVEFSLSELPASAGAARRVPVVGGGAALPPSSLDQWAFIVSAAAEPCLLIDLREMVVAVSPGCGPLFSIRPVDAVGHRLVDEVLRLRDFNAIAGELPDWDVDKIPPLLAARSGVLARGLLRVCADDVAQTVDAISTPLRDGGRVVGSLTFFAPVGP